MLAKPPALANFFQMTLQHPVQHIYRHRRCHYYHRHYHQNYYFWFFDQPVNQSTFPELDQVIVHTIMENILGLHGSVVVGRRTCDREVESSTPGRCIAG